MSVRSGSSMSREMESGGNYTPSDAAGLSPQGESSLTPRHGEGEGAGMPPGFGSVGNLHKAGSGRMTKTASGRRIPKPPSGSARGSEAGSARSASARRPGSMRKAATQSATARAQRLLLPSLDPGKTANNSGLGNSTLTSQQKQSLVAQLDSERRRHETEGRFLDAQECLDVMRMMTAEQGRQFIAETVQKNIASDAKQGLLDDHRKQVFKFTRLWEEALQEFEVKGDKHIADITERQRREFEEFEELIRSDLATRQNPHFSKSVLRGRQELAQLVELKRYKEADAVQRQLESAESMERKHFEEELSLKFASKTKQLKKRYMLELQTTRQKICQERDNLLTQRRSNYETLVQRHMNAVAAFEQRARTGAARDQKAMTRQLDAMVSCPSKTTLANLGNK